MASKFSLEAILSLTDKMTTPFLSSTQKILNSNKRLVNSFKKVNNGINKAIGFAGKQLKRAAMIGIFTLTAAVGVAATEFVHLDDSITAAGAKFIDIDSTASDFRQNLKQLSSAAREVASVTEFAATDASGALDKFAMAGFRSDQAMALLMGTTNLATAAGTDLTTAVDIATDSLGAFNLMTDDAAQLQKNLARVSDIMAKTTVTANTDLNMMFESIKKGGPAFVSAGQSVESFAALVGTLANSGIKAEESGTQLRNMMLRLSKPTGEADKVLKLLGVNIQDQAGNFRDVVDIIADFEKGLKGMGSAQKTAALTTVFGTRSVTGMNILLGEGSQKLREYRGELTNSKDAALNMAEAMRGSLGNRIKVLKSGLLELGLQFIEAFEINGRNALDLLIEKVQEFDIAPVVEGARNMYNIMKNIFTFISENLGTIKALAIGLASAKVAMIGFNIVMNANPIMLIVTAIGLLVAGIMKVIDAYKKFKQQFTGSNFGDFINPFSQGNQTIAREERSAMGGNEMNAFDFMNAGYADQVKVEREKTIESRQRHDLYLHSPQGHKMSEAGGVPETAVSLGAQ